MKGSCTICISAVRVPCCHRQDPVGFWNRQKRWARNGLSWHSIAGKYMVFVTDSETCRMVMNENGTGKFIMASPGGFLSGHCGQEAA